MAHSFSKYMVFVLYDSIQNSVFHSMVLTPLLNKLNTNQHLTITLISFEPRKIHIDQLRKRIPQQDRLQVIICHRVPFVGRVSLLINSLQLYCILKKIAFDQIIARGPLAGWMAMKASKWLKRRNIHVVIQARGLCAQEYRYSHMRSKQNLFKHLWHQHIYRTLDKIEYIAYGSQMTNKVFTVTIEVVSPALKGYLITTFHAKSDNIIISSDDAIQSVPSAIVSQWRTELRKLLGIKKEAYVYCYSGSYKPWQCADQTIRSFVDYYQHDKRNFLLILSQDKDYFFNILEQNKISPSNYLILSVLPHEVLQYLSIADAGFLFREADIINWVSRPTKLLEYQAVGLNIIHNHTVGLLNDHEKSIEASKV